MRPTGRDASAVELFAGAGGAALGLHRAGFRHLVAIERDPKAAATLRAAGFPAVEILVEHFRYRGARPLLLWASPPCVAWSSAGERGGSCDPRALWPVTLEQIMRIRPVWVVVENVPAAPFDEWRKQLDLLYPFTAVWSLNAKDFRVPQDRARKFLVAGPEPVSPPKATGQITAAQAAPELRGKWLRTEMITARARAADAGPAPTIVTKSILYVYPTDVGVRKVHKLGPGGKIAETPMVARLQGFPADYPFQGSKGDRWKQIGNAVPPPMAEAIGRAILAEAIGKVIMRCGVAAERRARR
jgi:DNA (cytosine-5)-methyltransferase 1